MPTSSIFTNIVINDPESNGLQGATSGIKKQVV